MEEVDYFDKLAEADGRLEELNNLLAKIGQTNESTSMLFNNYVVSPTEQVNEHFSKMIESLNSIETKLLNACEMVRRRREEITSIREKVMKDKAETKGFEALQNSRKTKVDEFNRNLLSIT